MDDERSRDGSGRAWLGRRIEGLCWAGLTTLWLLVILWALRLGESITVMWVATAVLHLLLFGAWVAVAVGVSRRRWALVGAASLTIGVQVLVAWPLLPWPGEDGGREPLVTVASLNWYVDNAEPAPAARHLADQSADILAIQEFTPEAQVAMDRHLDAGQYPHRVELPDAGTVGQAIYSRYPIAVVPAAETATDTLAVDVTMPNGDRLRVFNVHAFGPQSGDPGVWIRSIHELERVLDATDGPWVAIGDYNATVDHRVYRDLLGDGRHDAHLSTGRGLARTFPAHGVLPPVVLIDHAVLSADLVATETTERTIPGADHRLIQVGISMSAGRG